MSRFLRPWGFCALATVIVASNPAPGKAQEGPAAKSSKKQPAVDPAERASGVIVKVEPVANADRGRAKPEKTEGSHGGSSRLVRLTINTDAIWSDWARDQVTRNATQDPKKAAEKGARSVATEGEPQTENSLVVVALVPASKVLTRFRTLTEEASTGEKTPSEARGEGKNGSKSKAAKPPQYAAKDLRPGLFVEVDFRRRNGSQEASTVTVIRPVSDEGVPTEAAK